MNWIVTILALIFVTLLAIAVELRFILQEMRSARSRPEPQGGPREIQGAGQTINVNLSPLSGLGSAVTVGSGVPSTSGSVAAPEARDISSDGSKGEDEIQSEGKDSRPLQARATPSGAFSVKCPRCEAENSSYRTECFNCGASL
jgi:hypothetical protein